LKTYREKLKIKYPDPGAKKHNPNSKKVEKVVTKSPDKKDKLNVTISTD